MKKTLLYSLAALASISLASCAGDYDDWAEPQSNPQEEATAKYGVSATAGSEATITLPDADGDVHLVTFTASNEAVAGYTINSIKINGEEIAATMSGNDVVVNANTLTSLVYNLYGTRAAETRQLTVESDVAVNLTSGDAVTCEKMTTSATVTPPALPEADSKGYYLLGGFAGCDWDPAKPIWMTDNGDGTFSAKVETTGTSTYWGLYRGSNFVAGDWDSINQGALGSNIGDNTATTGLIFGVNDPVDESHNSMVIPDAGKYKVTFDTKNYTYSVAPVYEELYLTGDHYSWGGTWKQLTPIYGSDSDFWTIIYLHADEQFKFAPQADWGGDFGMEATIDDQAGAGVADAGGNIQVKNAGWYLLHVVNAAERKVSFLKPEIYLMGSVAPVNDWSINAGNLFTVPTTEDGEFVSPAFSADGEVRICISLPGFDWWMTEFIVANDKIDYRGKGGDQDRVNVVAGQKVYLNFSNGTGKYE